MLPCVCSVIDHRWRQNAVRTKSGTRGVVECVNDVLTTFWCLLWSVTESDEGQHGIYLFYVITKSLFYFKIFQHNAKPAFCPPLQEKKKPFEVIYDLYKKKQFHWLLCVAKNCNWSRKIAPLSNLTRRSSWNENLQRKQNWTAKSSSLEENAEKVKSAFVIGAALW